MVSQYGGWVPSLVATNVPRREEYRKGKKEKLDFSRLSLNVNR
jgi:hypothetical protein